ncbi:MAG TPA: YcxB family protein [Haloplasmataceae bacterium]
MEFKYLYNHEDDAYNAKFNNVSINKIKQYYNMYRIILLIFTVMFLSILIFMIVKGTIWYKILIFAIGMMLPILNIYLKLRLFSKVNNVINYQMIKGEEEEIIITISDDGIIEKDSYNNEILYKWKNIMEVFINDKYMDIMMNKSNPLIIPLRVFNNDKELDEFLELLTSKIKDKQIYNIK